SISSFKFSFCSALNMLEDNTKLSTGQYNTSLNHANTSPKADCPASKPTSPGITEPSTCPQIPRTGNVPLASLGDTIISHVEVPITRTKVLLSIFAPTAPECASKVPTATIVFVVKPSLSAHS